MEWELKWLMQFLGYNFKVVSITHPPLSFQFLYTPGYVLVMNWEMRKAYYEKNIEWSQEDPLVFHAKKIPSCIVWIIMYQAISFLITDKLPLIIPLSNSLNIKKALWYLLQIKSINKFIHELLFKTPWTVLFAERIRRWYGVLDWVPGVRLWDGELCAG